MELTARAFRVCAESTRLLEDDGRQEQDSVNALFHVLTCDSYILRDGVGAATRWHCWR